MQTSYVFKIRPAPDGNVWMIYLNREIPCGIPRVFAEGEQNNFFSTKHGFQCSFVHRFRIYVPNRPTHPLRVAGLRLMFEKNASIYDSHMTQIYAICTSYDSELNLVFSGLKIFDDSPTQIFKIDFLPKCVGGIKIRT